ncbi:MAG: hypothetical protein IJO97_05035 [Lachnospiraceae bacterium]|nr:hypothetical protein [Lachnospiraceae bacterium]
MKVHTFFEKNKNCIISILTVLVNVVLMSLLFDFYYDLNDDVMMKDIMAGVYTGTPDGHNMQTLYILGAFISLCYRLCRGIPWYGLFLFVCQMGSVYLVGVRLLCFCKKVKAKAGCMVLLSLFLWGITLPHLLAIQYTITASVMAAAAIFLFLTTEKELSPKQFIMQNMPSMVLVVVAFCLRTEMLLLVFPLICLAGLFRWMEEERFFEKENFLKYGITIGCILVGMLVSRLLDYTAYGSEEWQRFLVFFDKRTEIYDYHYEVLTSGEHAEYLASLGLNEAQQELLSNYNFGLDETIDEKLLAEIAVYAEENTSDTEVSLSRLVEKGKLYVYRTLHDGDAPYNYIVLAGYLCVVVMGTGGVLADKKSRGRWRFVWEIVLLGIFRTILWMYVLMMGRDPVRITHSLYLAEFAVLAGMLYRQCEGWMRKEGKGQKLTFAIATLVMLGFLFGCYLPHSIMATRADKTAREEVNKDCLTIAEYCKAHPDNFYFEDVYSTVSFSQKIFEDVDNSLSNYDIMGGWMCKSPLYYDKLEQFGMTTMEEGLLYDENVYFIMDMTADDTDWMRAYYAGKGIAVSVEQVDKINDAYAVYQVVEQKEN